MTVEELKILLTVRSENEHIEFKEAKSNFHFEKLVDYCVALANEGGGRMVLGVTDKLPRQVVGTSAFDIPAKTCGGIFERIHLKVACEEIAHPSRRVREQQDHQQRIDPRTVRNRKAELRPSHPHPQRGCCQKPDLPRRPGCGPQNQTLRSLLGLISLILTLLKRAKNPQTIGKQQFFI